MVRPSLVPRVLINTPHSAENSRPLGRIRFASIIRGHFFSQSGLVNLLGRHAAKPKIKSGENPVALYATLSPALSVPAQAQGPQCPPHPLAQLVPARQNNNLPPSPLYLLFSSPIVSCFFTLLVLLLESLHILLKMTARPQNIGIKAIEIYFPSQVRSPLAAHRCHCPSKILVAQIRPLHAPQPTASATSRHQQLTFLPCSMSSRLSLKSLTASPPASTPLVSVRPRWPFATTAKVRSPLPLLRHRLLHTCSANHPRQTFTPWLSPSPRT